MWNATMETETIFLTRLKVYFFQLTRFCSQPPVVSRRTVVFFTYWTELNYQSGCSLYTSLSIYWSIHPSLSRIKCFLSKQSTEKLSCLFFIRAFIFSGLNYCNGGLQAWARNQSGSCVWFRTLLPESLQTPRNRTTSQILRSLYWLPVSQRRDLKSHCCFIKHQMVSDQSACKIYEFLWSIRSSEVIGDWVTECSPEPEPNKVKRLSAVMLLTWGTQLLNIWGLLKLSEHLNQGWNHYSLLQHTQSF